MEQIENSQKLVYGDEEISSQDAKVYSSLDRVLVQGKAAEMFSLLKQIAQSPSMFHANVSDIGMKVKSFVDGVQSEIEEPGATLLKIVAQAEVKSVSRVTRRKP